VISFRKPFPAKTFPEERVVGHPLWAFHLLFATIGMDGDVDQALEGFQPAPTHSSRCGAEGEAQSNAMVIKPPPRLFHFTQAVTEGY
jgi:hypothetical protein